MQQLFWPVALSVGVLADEQPRLCTPLAQDTNTHRTTVLDRFPAA